jgi:hypothetical protein
MMYLLTAVGLTPGGSSTVHIYTQTVHRTLTSEVGKQMEHVVSSYLRQVWDKNDWLYESQHGFRLGYSCESQVITVYQDIADCLGNGDRIDGIIVDFSKTFDL